VTLWAGAITVPTAERYIRDIDRLQRELPPRTIGGAIAMITEDAPFPSSDVRAVLARAPTGGNVVNVGSAIVIQGEGFRASAARAVLTGIGMASRSAPLRAFATLDEAIADVDRRVVDAGGAMPDRDALHVAFQALRLACSRA
jgi:hypothetical protein